MLVRRFLRAVNPEWGLDLDARDKQRVRAAAEEGFRATFPQRRLKGSRICSDAGGYYVVAVFQYDVRPSNSPRFFRVDKATGTAELEPDQLRHRRRDLK